MASNKRCILIETLLLDIQGWRQSLQEMFEVVSLETFLQNPAKYEAKIDAICGVSGAPLLELHIKNETFLNKLQHLRVLVSTGVGTDHLQLTDLWNRGIRVSTTGKANVVDTAEYGFTLLMASAKNLPKGIIALKEGQDFFTFWHTQCGTRLSGLTLGVVGMGSIGYKVAERAAAFEMNVLYHNRSQRSKEEEEKVKATYCDTLEKLLAQSDFVMLCVPLTKDTKCLIGAKELKLMKSTAALINISRGDVVDTEALVKALQEDDIKGAALDVTSPEPLPKDHPLLHMPNVIVTPHIGGATPQSQKDICKIAVENLLAGLEGRSMAHELKPPQH